MWSRRGGHLYATATAERLPWRCRNVADDADAVDAACARKNVHPAEPISSVGPNRRKVDGVSPLQPTSAIVKVYHSEG